MNGFLVIHSVIGQSVGYKDGRTDGWMGGRAVRASEAGGCDDGWAGKWMNRRRGGKITDRRLEGELD